MAKMNTHLNLQLCKPCYVKMPRKTPVKELLKEEEVPSSPLRRSSRIGNNSPVPTRVLARRNSASESSTSSTTKVTRSRRSSLSQEPEASSDKKKTSTVRTRRGSLTQNNEERVNEETVPKTRSRGSSVPKETTAEVKRTTRSRKSMSEDAESKEESIEKVTRSRSSSLTKKIEDNNAKGIAKKLKDGSTSTPIKKSTASSSSMDSSETLEPVEEDKQEVDSPEKSVKKRQTDVKVELDLSVINEVSLTEDEISPHKKSVIMEKSNEDQSENKSPQTDLKQVEETVVKITNEKSSDKLETPEVDTADNASENKMLDSSVSDTSFRLELDDSQNETGNKENICPPERESECEPMEVDESPEKVETSAPVKKTIKSRLSLIKKVTEVEHKLQDAEKVTNDIRQFLEEKSKLTPESDHEEKQQIISDETLVVEHNGTDGISETDQTKSVTSASTIEVTSVVTEKVTGVCNEELTATKIVTLEKMVNNETEIISSKENDTFEEKIVVSTKNNVDEAQENHAELKKSFHGKSEDDESEQLCTESAFNKQMNSEDNGDVSPMKKDCLEEEQQKISNEREDLLNTSLDEKNELKRNKLTENLSEKNSVTVLDISISKETVDSSIITSTEHVKDVSPKTNSSQLEIAKNETVVTKASVVESHVTESLGVDQHKSSELETSRNEIVQNETQETDVCDTKTDEKKILENKTENENSVKAPEKDTNEKDELDLEVETINKSRDRTTTEEQDSELGEEQTDLCESKLIETKGDENDYVSPVKKLKTKHNSYDDLDQSTDSKYSVILKPNVKKCEINSSQEINTDSEMMDHEQDDLDSSQNEQKDDNVEEPKLNETTEKDAYSPRKRPSDRSSITLQEIVKVGEEKTVNERIHKVVDLFCAGIRNNADISINVSLEYTGQMSDSEDEKTDLLSVSLTASNLMEKEPEHQKRSKRRKICNDDIAFFEKSEVQEEVQSVTVRELEETKVKDIESPVKKRSSFNTVRVNDKETDEQEKLEPSSSKKIKKRKSLPERNETKIKNPASPAKKRHSLNASEKVNDEQKKLTSSATKKNKKRNSLTSDNFVELSTISLSDESEVDVSVNESSLEDSTYNKLLSKSFEEIDGNDTTWKPDDEEVSSSAESAENEESFEDEESEASVKVLLENKLNELSNQTAAKEDSPKREAKKSPRTSKKYLEELPSPIRNTESANNSLTILEKNSPDSKSKIRRKSISCDSSLNNTSLVQISSVGESSAQKRKKRTSASGHEITENLDTNIKLNISPRKKVDLLKPKEKTPESGPSCDREQSDDESAVSNSHEDSNFTNLLSNTLEESDLNDTTWKPDQEKDTDDESVEDEDSNSSSLSSEVFEEKVIDQTKPKNRKLFRISEYSLSGALATSSEEHENDVEKKMKKTGSGEVTKRSKKNKPVKSKQRNIFEETKHVNRLVPEMSETQSKKSGSQKRKRLNVDFNQEPTSVKSDNEEFVGASKTKKKRVKDLREKLNSSRDDNVSYVKPSSKAASGWEVSIL